MSYTDSPADITSSDIKDASSSLNSSHISSRDLLTTIQVFEAVYVGPKEAFPDAPSSDSTSSSDSPPPDDVKGKGKAKAKRGAGKGRGGRRKKKAKVLSTRAMKMRHELEINLAGEVVIPVEAKGGRKKAVLNKSSKRSPAKKAPSKPIAPKSIQSSSKVIKPVSPHPSSSNLSDAPDSSDTSFPLPNDIAVSTGPSPHRKLIRRSQRTPSPSLSESSLPETRESSLAKLKAMRAAKASKQGGTRPASVLQSAPIELDPNEEDTEGSEEEEGVGSEWEDDSVEGRESRADEDASELEAGSEGEYEVEIENEGHVGSTEYEEDDMDVDDLFGGGDGDASERKAINESINHQHQQPSVNFNGPVPSSSSLPSASSHPPPSSSSSDSTHPNSQHASTSTHTSLYCLPANLAAGEAALLRQAGASSNARPAPSTSLAAYASSSANAPWICAYCTFNNEDGHLRFCDICEQARA